MKKLPISIELPDAFFKAEEKCQYFISEKQKRIWAVELDLLVMFDKICKKYGIDYSLFAGTMLGAIRHEGFIPWDDDVDVCMDRANFKRLLDVPSAEFPHPYFLQSPYSDTRFFCPYARLRNSETTGIIAYQASPDYNNGIYIDIFVLDGRPEFRTLQAFHHLLSRLATRCVNAYIHGLSEFHGAKKISYCLTKAVVSWLPYPFWVDFYHNVLGMFNKKSLKFAMLTHSYFAFPKYWLTREEMADYNSVPFEGYMFPCVRNYDTVLKRIYGDYMAFPPVEKRGTWHQGIIEFDPDVPYKDFFKNRGNKFQGS